MKKIIINIKNTFNKPLDIVLMDALYSDNTFKKEGLVITVDIIDPENKENTHTISYAQLIHQLQCVPCEIKIAETSNNRQIDFYVRTVKNMLYGYKYNDKPYVPLEPHLTKTGKKRRDRWSAIHNCYEFSPKWELKEWNIADTHEYFILDDKIVFELQLKPKQRFSISIDIMPKLDISKIISSPIAVTFSKPKISEKK